MKNKYRIVQDSYLGYEAQVKFWWFPFVWWQMHKSPFLSNTHSTLKNARSFIKKKSEGKFVEHVE